MAIYDGHIHLNGVTAPNPALLLERMESCGIVGGNLLSIDPEDANYTFRERMDNLFQWVKGYEDRLFPIAWLLPDEENVLDKVREAAARGVKGFKFIPCSYYVQDEKPQQVFRLIEELGLPIIFHSGILYDFNVSSQYNRPLNWDCFSAYKNLRFSMGHCSYPWYDECIALYGKFRWLRENVQKVAQGEPSQFHNWPWITEHLKKTDHGTDFETPELFLDTTPGAWGIYRKDLFTKLAERYPDGDYFFFGTDQYAEEYSVDFVTRQLRDEKEALDAAGASAGFREKMYCKNFLRFMNLRETD